MHFFPPPVKVSNPTAQIGSLVQSPVRANTTIGLQACQSTQARCTPPMTGLDPFAPPLHSLTFTGLGKMAPLRVTMTDLDGTRLRPKLPGTTETSPPLLPLGPLQRAPGRTAIRASRQAAEDAISCSAPRRDPHPTHPVRPSRRKPASSLARLSNTRPHSPYACAVPALLSPWESPGHPPYVVTSVQRRPSRTPEGGAVRLELRL